MTEVEPEQPMNYIPKAVFRRLAKEEAGEYNVAQSAIDLLQRVAEETVVSHFELANAVAAHKRRVTVSHQDMQYAIEVSESLLNPTDENGQTAVDALFDSDMDASDDEDDEDFKL